MRPGEYFTWPARDRALAEGFLYLEAATPDHGVPGWLARDAERGSWFEAKKVIDHAQAALDDVRHAKDYKPMPGERLVVVDTYKPDDEPPERSQTVQDDSL